MEQTNMVMAMYQAMASQGMVPKVNTAGDKEYGDFQKLLDQKAQTSAKSDTPVEQKPKTDAVSKEEGPAQDDPLEQVKKLAEQGYTLTQSNMGAIPFDPNNMTLGQTEAGEYVVMQMGEDGEVLSVIELDPWQQQQLQQFMHNMELMDQAKDPEADAVLEAIDPTVEHSPADLLETAVDEQAGSAVSQAVEEAKPQEKDEQGEVIDLEQAPQQLFHDVKAAPVKVGDVEPPQQTQEPNVAGQIDAKLAQALQAGDTTVRIQLTPENLGEVTVEITQNADGALHVELTAHNADTRGLLERHAGDLQGMLAGRTQQNVEVNVQRQQESQQDQNQQHQHNYDGHNGHAQDGQERRRQHQEHTSPEDFMQQLRLGLIPTDGEF